MLGNVRPTGSEYTVSGFRCQLDCTVDCLPAADWQIWDAVEYEYLPSQIKNPWEIRVNGTLIVTSERLSSDSWLYTSLRSSSDAISPINSAFWADVTRQWLQINARAQSPLSNCTNDTTIDWNHSYARTRYHIDKVNVQALLKRYPIRSTKSERRQLYHVRVVDYQIQSIFVVFAVNIIV